jgi:hypothetical protein
MPLHRVAYISLIAAVVAFRLACAGAPVSASDRLQSGNPTGNPSAAQGESSVQDPDSTPLITGRSVAVPSSQASGMTGGPERRLHDVGAAGFARR